LEKKMRRLFSSTSSGDRHKGFSELATVLFDQIKEGKMTKLGATSILEKHYASITDSTLSVGEFARLDMNRASRVGFPEGYISPIYFSLTYLLLRFIYHLPLFLKI
jgi:hypothetical protein